MGIILILLFVLGCFLHWFWTTRRRERSAGQINVKCSLCGKEFSTSPWDSRATQVKPVCDDCDWVTNIEPRYRNAAGYPKDWRTRRLKVYEQAGGKCVSCGQELPLHWGSPHVHHKVPLSKGGNHALSNLVLLCPGCHLTEHSNNKGLESLVYGVTTSPSRISRREQHFSNDMQQIITGAIKNQKKIEFFYKKPTESTYKKRTVRPIELNSVAHKHGVGRTLCVKGYCEQRKDIRHFAIKRMKNLRVI